MAFNLTDLAEEKAKSILPPMLYDYLAGGAGEEQALAENIWAFRRVKLRGRSIHDIDHSDASCSLPGAPELSFPCIIAPMGFAGLVTPGGEEYMARAAAACDIKMTVSTLSISSLESVAAAAPLSEPWFQLYALNDSSHVRETAKRAQAAGYGAVVLTVDSPVFAKRPRDEKNGFCLPEGVTLGNFSADELPPLASAPGRSLMERFADRIAKCTPPSRITELTETSELPVWIKGVLHPEDARTAAHAGAAGVIVSNHGGRQLDCAPAALDVLPGIRAAVGARYPLIVDGGVRSGADIAKALAMGADAVMIGRPVLWALATEGPEGVVRLLARLKKEFLLTLRLLGCPSATTLRAEGNFYVFS